MGCLDGQIPFEKQRIQFYRLSVMCYSIYYSLEANHLIWVWIMKVKGPKNQTDFIEVL